MGFNRVKKAGEAQGVVREVTFPSRKKFTVSSGSDINRGEGIFLLRGGVGEAVPGPPRPLPAPGLCLQHE